MKKKLYNVDAVPYSSILLDHENTYKYLITEENKLHNLYHRSVMRPFNNVKIVENMSMKYNNFLPNMIKIDKYYDNNGKRHNFNIYVYQKANDKGDMSGAKKEFTLKDIQKRLGSSNYKEFLEFKQLFIVDYRCSVCNVLMSQTKNVNVINEIKKRDNVSVFYKYFENICPKGELHEFTNQKNNEKLKASNENRQTDQCVKCGLTKKIFDTYDSKYYAKYCKIYQKVQKKMLDLEKSEILNLMKKSPVINKTPTFPDWKINNYTILEISQTFNIKYNVWVNLGLSTGIEYELIEKEKINPSTDLKPVMSILRNNQLYGYFMYIVKQISAIKYYANMEKLPYELKELLNKNKVADLEQRA